MATEDSEAFAAEVIRRVTGHQVELIDDGSRPRMPDGRWVDDAGRIHVVEVTRLLPTEHAQLVKELEKRDHRVPVGDPVERRWSIHLRSPVRLSLFDGHELSAMLFEAESRRVGRLSRLPLWHLRGFGRTGQAVADGKLDAVASVDENPGWAWVFMPSMAGGAPGMVAVVPWLKEALRGTQLAGKIDKLRDWPADVRHLFVGFAAEGVPFAVGDAFWTPDVTPPDDPDLPTGLDAVWLQPFLKHEPLSWTPEHGWRRHDVLG